MFNQKNITIFISGGIAAYKVPLLARLLQKAGANVRVVMTQAAQAFVTPAVFEALLHEHTYTQLFADPQNPKVVHIEIADWTEIAIIVPATANVVGKMANGIADDLLTSTLLAIDGPKYLVPAMNSKMLHNPAVVRNLAQLTADGINVLPTAKGLLAEGYAGDGRMLEPQEIFDYIELAESVRQSNSHLKHKRVLISAGGTRERIDSVRYITNDSSGKMGYALAKAAAYAGAKVTLVSTIHNLPVPLGVELVAVQSALEMQQAIESRFDQLDIVIMAAAISDYRPAQTLTYKIKKGTKDDLTKLELVKNPDILAGLGQKKQHQFLVGFAAETSNLEQYALKKLAEKHVDMIVANDVSQASIGFNSDDNAVTVLTNTQKSIRLAQAAKPLIAQKLIELISQHI
ncbi:MAG: bifunctional phosphopantothenoylcysteine decarboxylase/phosphopantothenate--cysteine ligase CoaBC [Lactobacillus sp.]|nr:bifunctional phosphopantothenoylcysteine decarboxylase/phosphopantothenate--cysteine ligase CoaBC [Lactobacillus sp.]